MHQLVVRFIILSHVARNNRINVLRKIFLPDVVSAIPIELIDLDVALNSNTERFKCRRLNIPRASSSNWRHTNQLVFVHIARN
jgi:hypothetical protein